VSITDHLPRLGLLERTHRKPRRTRHRAIDEVERQKALRAGADILIRGLRLQLAEQEDRHAEVIARIDARHAETVRGLERQIAELEHRLDVGVKAEHVVAKTQEIDPEEVARICAQSTAGINPPPAVTQVMPLHQSPLASPAHVPTWAKRT
jgi:hypothetical protein